ncbi:hypothetical protein PC129_g19131 [Phytophthora cactorum]|uniref:Uncharacterized protein n=1 Tax=Phytophthora cactorum TaxID=29920 RepID=A0A8T1HE53_9STRA|nr:hypothetical protein PC119_g20255 [Phytophthora cactorum]KAG3063302.1 hypothetical protein PC122_g18929 [Phytophthora cactorum]KAG3209862.1 hypothetical protein PC129_g19131 [Phytophthora cactorum]
MAAPDLKCAYVQDSVIKMTIHPYFHLLEQLYYHQYVKAAYHSQELNISSASDISAFEHSVEPAPAETLFKDKKWTYIQDSTSNTGQYSGQIQFNLSTISSQAAFVNWEEAIIELPVKLQILNGGAASVTSTGACTIDQLVPKAGAWQFLDSVQVVIDGVCVQTNQVHENVNATFKALTEWDQPNYAKLGATSNFVMDSYAPPVPNIVQALDNVATTGFLTTNANVGEFGLASTFTNKGVADRSLFTALDQQSDTSGGKINPATNVASISNNMNVSNTCPILYNCSSATATAIGALTGLTLPASAVTLTITADVNGTAASRSGLTPNQTFSRLLVPTYTPNPSADHSLHQKKTFRYFERITNKFTVAPSQGFTWTISTGIVHPRN